MPFFGQLISSEVSEVSHIRGCRQAEAFEGGGSWVEGTLDLKVVWILNGCGLESGPIASSVACTVAASSSSVKTFFG